MYSTGACWWSSELDDRNMREMPRKVTRCTALSVNARLVRSRTACIQVSATCMHGSSDPERFCQMV